nr:MAG TPA: Pannexin-like TM region of LRRC8 [Caudoviricetes sp.]
MLFCSFRWLSWYFLLVVLTHSFVLLFSSTTI